MDCKTYCKNCPKDVHCCIFKNGGFTFLTTKDAKIIKSKIKKDFAYFLDFSPLPKKIITSLKNCDPALEGGLRYSQLDKQNKLLRLKTKKEGRCIFLDDDGKCVIYEIRPNVCRMYPFWGLRLTNGKIKIVEHGINSKCELLKSFKLNNSPSHYNDIEKDLSKRDLLELKKIFSKIEKERL
jgi:Fe-S-cluster containining protein